MLNQNDLNNNINNGMMNNNLLQQQISCAASAAVESKMERTRIITAYRTVFFFNLLPHLQNL